MGEGLSEVFSFYLSKLGDFIDVLKCIPVFENVSLFHTIIALGLISIFIKIIKYGFTHTRRGSSIRIYDTDRYRDYDRDDRGVDR